MDEEGPIVSIKIVLFLIALVVLVVLGAKWNHDHIERFALTEKVTFEGVKSARSSQILISFKNVWMNTNMGNKKIDVWIQPESQGLNWFDITVNPDFKGTLISVEAEGRGVSSACNAERVIIHVRSEAEKVAWIRWAEVAEKTYFDYQRSQTEPPLAKYIAPNIY